METTWGILCYGRVKYRGNRSDKRMCGVTLEEIHTKHINTLCGQNVELLNVKCSVRTAQ